MVPIDLGDAILYGPDYVYDTIFVLKMPLNTNQPAYGHDLMTTQPNF